MKRLLLSLAMLAAIGARPVLATPMNGQPVPEFATVRQAARLAYDIAGWGDPVAARTSLLMLIESDPAADLIDQFGFALRDTNTYTAVLATYEDTLAEEKDPKRQAYIRFNILRALVYRATFLPTTARRALITRATDFAEALAKENTHDAGIWEGMGDLYVVRDDTDNAVAAYRHISTATGGSPVLAQRKTAYAYARIRRYDAAKEAYDAAIRADTAQGSGGGMDQRHLLYQGLGWLYLEQGRMKEAGQALLLSAKVKQRPDNPYTLRLDLADALRRRGLTAEVRAYAQEAVKFAPDDDAARELLRRARQ